MAARITRRGAILGGALLAAPACGIAALTVVTVAAERIGAPLDATITAVTLSCLAAGGGYVLLAVRRPARRGDGGTSIGEGQAEVGAPAHVP